MLLFIICKFLYHSGYIVGCFYFLPGLQAGERYGCDKYLRGNLYFLRGLVAGEGFEHGTGFQYLGAVHRDGGDRLVDRVPAGSAAIPFVTW